MTSNNGQQQYWHVLALSKELKNGQSLKRNLYDQRVLLWRDNHGETHALLNCCSHRRAPLQIKNYESNCVVCPYHGWEFNEAGAVTHVPSDPGAPSRLKCRVPHFETVDRYGFIWIAFPFIGKGEADEVRVSESVDEHVSLPDLMQSPPDLKEWVGLEKYESWPVVSRSFEFATTDELLIENFMDPTHTSVVHDGLIRSSQDLREHAMEIEVHPRGVRVDFAEQEEKVGLGLRAIYGASMKVKHCDEFLFPNFVRVTYEINGKECFMAFIACTPLEMGTGAKTLALIQLRHRLGLASSIASPFIAWLAGKILKQDAEITEMQFRNQVDFKSQRENLVAADVVAVRVKEVRRLIAKGEARPKRSTQSLKLRF